MTKTVLRLTIFLLAALPALAQCALCKLAVEQDPSLGTAFNKAILLMMFPALAVFAGVFIVAARSREAGNKPNNTNKGVKP